jgi:hypothetical protein
MAEIPTNQGRENADLAESGSLYAGRIFPPMRIPNHL